MFFIAIVHVVSLLWQLLSFHRFIMGKVKVGLYYTPGIYAKGYTVFVFLYPQHLCRGLYSFHLSVHPFVCSFVCNSVPFVELLQSFTLKQFKSGIPHQPLIRKHSYLDHRYPGASSFIP